VEPLWLFENDMGEGTFGTPIVGVEKLKSLFIISS
jgi:hypothetical protein